VHRLGKCGLSAAWFRRAGIARLQAVVCAGCAAIALGLLISFWSDLCLWRADALLIDRQHETAARWVERSLWFGRSSDARTCLVQLRIARRRQDFREVERQLQLAERLAAPRPELERQRLLALAQTDQFGAMQGEWGRLLSDQRDDGPEIARAFYDWSMLHHNLPQAEKALRLWQDDYPRDPEPLALAGRFYEALVNWEAAEDAYRRASALAPANDAYRLSLAHALQIRLKTREALPIYREYLGRHPRDVTALRGLAQCLATGGELQQAVELLRQAFEVNPNDFATQKDYGEMLLSAGDAPAAVAVLESAYRAVPEHAHLANSLARALKECGRVAEARPLFDFVAESRPQLDRLMTLEKRLRKEPEDLELRMTIASLTAKYVSRQDAIRWYAALLQVAPDYVPAHEALADLYRQTGQTQLAEYHAKFATPKGQRTKSAVSGPPQNSAFADEAR
jgi:tetratricopeptide (TPR) repeat protein